MSKFVCTRCNWEGTEDQLTQVPVCPNCAVGHSPLWKLLKKADDLECPNCSWRAKMDVVPKEPECPKCHCEYINKFD